MSLRRPWHRIAQWPLLGILLFLARPGCTDVDIFETPGLGSGQQDNKMKVKGGYCTEHPDELSFPVKILFVIDCSQSMKVTDPPPSPNEYPKRVQAIWEVIQKYRFEAGISFAILRFESAANVATQRDTNGDQIPDQFGFINDLPALLRALLQLQTAGGNTNYQAALGLAEATLAMDMSTTSLEERGRTKYVVIFLSDGLPYPVNYQENVNTPLSIERTLNELMNLPRRFEVVDFTIHTAYLSVGTPDYVKKDAENLLKQMAQIGGGTYRNFENGEQINFLDIDYTSIKRMYTLKDGAFMASNLNAHPSWTRSQAVDTDGDGLVDELELELGTGFAEKDTDGDGFGDLLEYNLKSSGFDPLDPGDADCRLALDRLDRDGDGLLDCEERFIGTSPELFDSDADGLPDQIELISGTNPVVADAEIDTDYDGSFNGSEVAWHTNPLVNDAAYFSKLAYRYKLSQRPGVFESRQCYDFEVSNISLMGTKERRIGTTVLPGFNDIMVYVGQVPQDRPNAYGLYRVACARTRYIPRYPEPDVKYPPTGLVKFQQKNFKRPVATACTGDDQCPYQVCDPSDHLCMSPLGNKCDAATPCPNFSCKENPVTLQSFCEYPVAVACLTGEDCPFYPVHPVTGMCMDPLLTAPDAANLCPRRECIAQYLSCRADGTCEDDDDNPANFNPTCLGGFCRKPCVDSAGCNPGETCEADLDKEYPPCTTPADCPVAGMQCQAGGCRKPCGTATDCSDQTATCEGGLCVFHHCVDHHGGSCAPILCSSETDCPTQPCDVEVGRCRTQPCLDSRECGHQRCELVVGMCMGPTCEADSDCRGERGYTCNDVVGDPCIRDIDCPFNFCSQPAQSCFFGKTPCISNTDCNIPNVNQNICLGANPPNNPGQCKMNPQAQCMNDNECAPNFCKSYFVCVSDPSQTCTTSLDCKNQSYCVKDSATATTGHCLNNPAVACTPATENMDNACQVNVCSRNTGLGSCDTTGQETCVSDNDCPPYACNVNKNICLYPVSVACLADSDCPVGLGMVCNQQQGFCEKSCNGDSDCPRATCRGRCLPFDLGGRKRCSDWFDPDRDCLVFGVDDSSGSSATGP